METFIEFFVGDNCSTNVKMARQSNIPFVGCKSHLLNLDVQGSIVGKESKATKKRKNSDITAELRRTVILKIDKLCGKLNTVKNAAVLRAGGVTVMPVRINATRWSSIYRCILRYVNDLHSPLQNLNFGKEHDDILALMPTPSEFELLKSLLVIMNKLDDVSLVLQRDNIKLCHAHALLNSLLSDVPFDMPHIDPAYTDTTDYHRNYNFEQAICKIQMRRESELTLLEKDAVKIFLKSSTIKSTEGKGYADAIVTSVDSGLGEFSSSYRSVSHVTPTSNVVERLFSMCKNTMSDRRKHMGPECLEY